MKLKNPFRYLTKFEWCLWSLSVTVVTVAFFLGDRASRNKKQLAVFLAPHKRRKHNTRITSEGSLFPAFKGS